MADISILGCGWLGLPLAKALLEKGYTVNGSTTTAAKLSLLSDSGIRPYLISSEKAGFTGDLASFLDCRVLIVTIPPKKGADGYPERISSLFPDIAGAGIGNILFTSSISVYGDARGRTDETTLLMPDTRGANEIMKVERLLRAHFPKTTVLRLGGLTGPGRHPVTHLAGRVDLPDGDAPINLVHLEDCIGIMLSVMEQGLWGKTYNVVPPFHPRKSVYYIGKASQLRLPFPSFLDGGADGRIVDGSRITSDSGYRYRVTDSI